MCFPLPNGHVHLFGPDGVFGVLNNGGKIQSYLSEAMVAATKFPFLPPLSIVSLICLKVA